MGSESVMRPLGSSGGEVERGIDVSTPRTEGRIARAVESDFQSQARVTYCQHLPRNVFAVGLDLFSPTGEWGRR